MIRLQGRIDNAEIVPFYTRHPIIFPKGHRVTQLIVDHYHTIMLHQNQKSAICEICRKFWIPSIRNVVKKVTRDCYVGKINNPKPNILLMR